MAAVAAGETPAPAAASDAAAAVDVQYEQYKDESQLEEIVELVSKDLSEPYSIFTYRYFINNWPQLCLRVGCLRKLSLHAIRTARARRCPPPCRPPWTTSLWASLSAAWRSTVATCVGTSPWWRWTRHSASRASVSCFVSACVRTPPPGTPRSPPHRLRAGAASHQAHADLLRRGALHWARGASRRALAS